MAKASARGASRVFLSRFRRRHSENVHKWMTNKVISRWFPQSHGIKTKADADAWTRGVLSSKTTLAFGIVDASDKRLIGIASLHDIRPHQGTASVGIVIGDSALWRRGYGTASMDRLLKIAFKDLNLLVVEAHVMSGDTGATKGLKKYGFFLGGRVPSWYRRRGSVRADKSIFFLTRNRWRLVAELR
jgi:RimJ/RimL family protein N-acetyltransferase